MIYYFEAAAQTIIVLETEPVSGTGIQRERLPGAIAFALTYNAGTDAEAFATEDAYCAATHAFWALGLTAKQHRALIGKVEAAKLGDTVCVPSGRWTPGQFDWVQRQCQRA